ncbi:MAG: hypothetical protein HOW73_43730 [Polyangiaceae bacterium]|nr:hypothetical protein [Polyangiaceae bacterium]
MATVEQAQGLSKDERWPAIAADWTATRDTLQMWTQIVGKLKVALSPFQNQLWHTALHPTGRGLTTQPIPYDDGVFETSFDFLDHNLVIVTSSGGRKVVPLYERTVASFYEEVMGCLASLGIDVRINTKPQEVPNPIPFDQDTTHGSYDADAVNRFFRAMSASASVMWKHKSRFTGKASPVHFFWGSFDLTTTRHSGERAAIPPGRDYIYRVAENEANWAAGFWPGSGPIEYAAYYAYVIPEPEALSRAMIEPVGAVWNAAMREFILPYEAVRSSADPEASLMAFLESTYARGAELGKWDRNRLEISEVPTPRHKVAA